MIGYGAIARELARQAQALGVRVLALNHSGRRSPFEGFSQPGVGDPNADTSAFRMQVDALANAALDLIRSSTGA